MNILVINSGSSSLKYTLFAMEHEKVVFAGTVDRIGMAGATHRFAYGNGPDRLNEETRSLEIRDQGQALDEMLSVLQSGPLASVGSPDAVAHRVAHGGKFQEAAVITEAVMDEIRRMTPMIPLHHPVMIEEIEECRARMPQSVHVAVFDTSFHRSMPDKARIYGLPYRYFEKGYRRTGFHGNSHAYVTLKAAEFMKCDPTELRIISCHLGNGASLCAVDRGKSIDTTLGMTAVEGLMMGTRSGDVDPGLIPVIMKEDGLSPDAMITVLYRESGLLGLSGEWRDMRDIEAGAASGHPRATLALDAFCYKVKRNIGAMLMVLGGCDVLVFTGGIGTNAPKIREQCLQGAEELGFVLDPDRNASARPDANDAVEISAASSRIRILAVETFEELMMARQCKEVMEGTVR